MIPNVLRFGRACTCAWCADLGSRLSALQARVQWGLDTYGTATATDNGEEVLTDSLVVLIWCLETSEVF